MEHLKLEDYNIIYIYMNSIIPSFELVKSHIDKGKVSKNIFDNVDGDKNGYIQYEEFVRGCIDKECFLNDNNDDIIKFSFNFFDKDKSGEITYEEIEEILLKGIENDNNVRESVKNMIKEVDVDKDGKVSYREFKDMMKKLLQQ